MNKVKKVSLGFILIILGCSSQKENEFQFYPNLNDTSLHKKQLLNFRRSLYGYFDLPDITVGTSDSLEIRIWPNHAFDITKNVLIFKLGNGTASGHHYNSFMLPITNADGNVFTLTDLTGLGDSVFVVKKIVPYCGWKLFRDSINYFSLLQLPTQGDIKNFKIKPVLDGYGYDFEIATPHSYRYISYWLPQIYDYKECQKIVGLVEMLKRQLGDNFSWPLNKKVPTKN
ncbi:hypothetical protein [Lacibacter sp. H407]|uniref:hypothetical protein n=1 Tax=Lacibacter sp. H407 TaxID=3133423 RepID=UPI0030C214C6